jgi:hypothetical protein
MVPAAQAPIWLTRLRWGRSVDEGRPRSGRERASLQSRMLGRSRLLRRAVSDPQLRVIVLFLLLFVALALAWHLVGMADHSTGMMGACVALLVVIGLVFVPTEPLLPPTALPLELGQSPVPALGLPGPTGRSPPRQGTVLLM